MDKSIGMCLLIQLRYLKHSHIKQSRVIYIKKPALLILVFFILGGYVNIKHDINGHPSVTKPQIKHSDVYRSLSAQDTAS